LAPPFAPAFLRTRDVLRITSLSRATLYRRVNARRFPAPVHLGGRACGWPVAAILEWIRNPDVYRITSTDEPPLSQVGGRTATMSRR
jgi:predicted DNA-binding transcriptional regulator AlpA